MNIISNITRRLATLILGSLLISNAIAAGPTPPPDPSTNATAMENIKEMAVNAKNNAVTNINDAVIDILRGVKSAGGEVYSASKTAITKAVDFTMDQAPLVVKEFLHWRLAESIINMVIAAAVPILLLFIAHAFNKRSKDENIPESHNAMLFDKVGCRAFKWIFRIVGIIWLVFSVQPHLMTVAKISVAPRVYLIEYVVDNINTARGVTPSNNNR